MAGVYDDASHCTLQLLPRRNVKQKLQVLKGKAY